jgi:Ca2+-binding EF-hand superfamily protein
MARFFREQDIDEFRECFYLNAKHQGTIRSLDELSLIMRSLGMSPTISELKKYLKDKGGKMTFADFLETIHTHNQVERIPDEILDAFKASDTTQRGMVPAKDLKNILANWGEKLSPKEVDQIFREANVNINGMVNYSDFVRIVCAPVPDYY